MYSEKDMLDAINMAYAKGQKDVASSNASNANDSLAENRRSIMGVSSGEDVQKAFAKISEQVHREAGVEYKPLHPKQRNQ